MAFWHGRRVLITGHTGFKGSWLSQWLLQKGAVLSGLALAPETDPALFDQLGLATRMTHTEGDIRDFETVRKALDAAAPEVVFHLAAQPLVRRSYREPADTFATNVQGTVHVMEALRQANEQVSLVVVTTDKVYENREWVHPYRETDRLGGHDPYSASKAACEIAVESYRKSFFRDGPVALASARAGNVIGGGDWAEDRILPDYVRAAVAGRPLTVRNPAALRPWQHVLDPLAGYMRLAERLHQGDVSARSAYNFGPEAIDQRRVHDLIDAAGRTWPIEWEDASDPDAPHEAGLLALTIDKARADLNWSPRWHFDEAVARTVSWYRDVSSGAAPADLTNRDIDAFEEAGS